VRFKSVSQSETLPYQPIRKYPVTEWRARLLHIETSQLNKVRL